MRKPLIVIKLGGSALTNKKRIYTPNIPTIHRAAKQVAAIAKRFSVVLVHGAGSYGHIPVKKFGLVLGFKSAKQLHGLTVTKSKLLEWEMTFGRALLDHQVRVMPFVASNFILTRNGRIAYADLGPLKSSLRLGCVPSTGGDIVPDVKTGFSILSGDQIAGYLATGLKASRLIFGTDVDGIFDSNPKLNRRAELLTELTPASASRLAAKTRRTNEPDVTGGMAGKIKEAALVASKGIPTYFVNLTKDERLQKVAFGQKAPCSIILPA